MNEIEKLYSEDMRRGVFIETVADDQFDFVDGLANEDDDTSSESEDM